MCNASNVQFLNFYPKNIFFIIFLFSFVLLKPEKNIKKIFFIWSTGRNLFCYRNVTVSSPINNIFQMADLFI